jgi:hypothetical protein
VILRMYTAADLPQLTIWLGQAMAARAQQATGGRITNVTDEGMSISYSAAEGSVSLAQWLTDLQDTIAYLNGSYQARGPIHFTF